MDKKYLIDTSSLSILARYFHEFDENKILYEFIKNKFLEKKFILLKSVEDQCKRQSQGMIMKVYKFLTEENKIQKHANLPILDQRTHNKIDNSWVVIPQKNKLREEYQTHKRKFIEDADCQLILYAKEHGYIIITEESEATNDNKLYKKIPIICKQEEIECTNIVELLKGFQIKINYKIPKLIAS